jgi:UDP-N-acetylglucosamine--N-acetylmuramyl-(pentapeptide) pyrophosphoryl-undecaprenol N-acetylglucosamine transferase
MHLGNPVRSGLVPKSSTTAGTTAKEGPDLLIFGGSQGARAINELMPAALAPLPIRPRILHQTGAADADEVRERYAALGVTAEVQPFIDDMAAAYGRADLVVCRAGATTLAELGVVGLPAVLVPFPFATGKRGRARRERRCRGPPAGAARRADDDPHPERAPG